MKAEAMSYFHMPLMTIVGLMIFFTFFMVMTLWVFNKQRRPFYHQIANLPIGDEE